LYDQFLLPTLHCLQIFNERTTSSPVHIISVFKFGPPGLFVSTAGVTAAATAARILPANSGKVLNNGGT